MPLSFSSWRTAGPAALLALAALLPGTARAQTAQEPFGRVRIQYKKLNWQEFSTQNFTVMYYDGGEPSARRAVEYAEKELQRITALIGYYPYSKTTLLLYNSVGDLRQSNIGLSNDLQVNGGETPLARMSKVEIAFTGQQTDFKRTLSTELTQVLLNDMMYGGSLKEVLQSSYLLQLPDWFIGGAASYAAEGWSVDMDGYMRDMTHRCPNGNRTAPFFLRDARLAGQSIWNYMAERYGYATVQNVLNLTRITRDVETGISSTLNLPFRVFLKDWLTYYRDQNGQPVATLTLPDDKARQGGKNRRNAVFSQAVISPNGEQVAYALNDEGRYRVIIADRTGRHRHTVARGGYKTPDQQVETRLPVLAWRGNEQLAIAEISRGRMALHLRQASGRSLLRRAAEALSVRRPASVFDAYEQVLSMGYSNDGKALVFSAVRNGQNDLYLLRAGSGKAEQLTNDLFDDAQPVFLPGGQTIVFSSNRYLDSLGRPRPATFPNVVNNYDLFAYHLDGRTLPVTPLVSTISNETRPRALSDTEIVYLSEESGVRGLFRYSLTSKERHPLTSFLPNIQDFDYSPLSHALAFVAPAQGRANVYLYPDYPLPTALPLTKTTRQQTLEARSAPAPATVKPNPPKAAAPADSATAPAAGRTAKAGPRRANEAVNTADYTFEEDEPAPAASARKRRAAAVPATPGALPPPASTVAGPFRHDTRFMADNISTAVFADPLLGIGLQFKARLTDALENQRFDASIYSPFGDILRTTNLSASYLNQTKRYDWGVAYQKQAYFFETENAGRVRFARQELAPTVAYPLTHALSVRGGPRYVNTSQTLVGKYSTQNDVTTNFLGYQAELVFDNAINTGVNMPRGTRMKISLLQLNSVGNGNRNFGKLTIDLRHYQRLHRALVWANRASYGQFFGPQTQTFRLGGMDNWLNAVTTNGIQTINDPSQVFYQQFITNLRGFDYNVRTGPRYVLFNSELRFPIVQYFAHRPIYSGFFRNLQLVGFADAGTAYSGANPFSENNSFNTQIAGGNGNPFTATVTNFRNPFLIGYGAGVRTTLLGFYGKFDLAWGQQDYVTKGPKPYFTLGYDF